MIIHPSQAPASGPVRADTFHPEPDARIARLARLVAGVQQDFARRVAREEDPGGLFGYVGDAAPRYRPLLDHLRAEHRHLSAELDRLLWILRESPEKRWDELVAEVAALTGAIREHESLKDEILRDVCECAE